MKHHVKVRLERLRLDGNRYKVIRLEGAVSVPAYTRTQDKTTLIKVGENLFEKEVEELCKYPLDFTVTIVPA